MKTMASDPRRSVGHTDGQIRDDADGRRCYTRNKEGGKLFVRSSFNVTAEGSTRGKKGEKVP